MFRAELLALPTMSVFSAPGALEAVGCTAVRVVPRQGPAPMEHVISRTAATGARQDHNG